MSLRETSVSCCRVLAAAFVLLAAWWVDSADCRGAIAGPTDESDQQQLESLVDDLWLMDLDEDGLLDADEIPQEARRLVEHWAELAGLDPDGPLPIRALEEAVRGQSGTAGGFGAAVPDLRRLPLGQVPSVPGFGQVEDRAVPGFGLDGQSTGSNRAHREAAAAWLEQFDRNGDGFLDPREIRRTRWSGDPFRHDADGDGRLSRQELAQRSAEERAAEVRRETQQQPREEPWRQRQEDQPRPRDQDRRREDRGSADENSWGLSGLMLNRYDENHNGRLDPPEWRSLAGLSADADSDGDDSVDRRELAEWLTEVADVPQGDRPADPPRWFRQRDANSDGQVSMYEYADEWTDEKVSEFAVHDANSDGFITLEECLASDAILRGTYSNDELQVISPGRTVYSEIDVPDNDPIADLDVQVSITHPHDEHLDIFLISPDGREIELCTRVGGGNDHFDNTVFSDEANSSINEGRPPYRGEFRPEAVNRRQTSLKTFYGDSIQGTWTLMIRAARSDRTGALHRWSLIVKPAD